MVMESMDVGWICISDFGCQKLEGSCLIVIDRIMIECYMISMAMMDFV